MTRIDPAALAAALAGSPLVRELAFFESTPSTNAEAKRLAREGAPDGTLVVCHEQTAGRGRRGRTWESAAEDSVCMSLILRPAVAAALAPRYTIAAALGVCEALGGFGAEAAVKWPNDVLAHGRKLSGILLELGAEGERVGYIVCGIGVNVSHRAFAGELAQTASSLLLETGQDVPKERVISAVAESLAPRFAACAEDAAFAALLGEYRSRSCTLGQRVKLMDADGVRTGVAEGFDELGCLLLRTADGRLEAVRAGDVSLRAAE